SGSKLAAHGRNSGQNRLLRPTDGPKAPRNEGAPVAGGSPHAARSGRGCTRTCAAPENPVVVLVSGARNPVVTLEEGRPWRSAQGTAEPAWVEVSGRLTDGSKSPVGGRKMGQTPIPRPTSGSGSLEPRRPLTSGDPPPPAPSCNAPS